VQLSLTKTRIIGNTLVTSPNGTRQGAGLYTSEPVTLLHSVITRNAPDQCFGCSPSPAAATAAPFRASTPDGTDPGTGVAWRSAAGRTNFWDHRP
jgi:hypothetical protein